MPASNTAKSHWHLLKIQAGQREQGFEGVRIFAAALRACGDRGFDPLNEPRQIVIADIDAIDLKAFVETIQVRRSEQSGSQAIGVADAGAECRGRTLAVGAGDHDRDAL